jgi:putative effector of murein hydrolase LrgA (UPF0299 family)
MEEQSLFPLVAEFIASIILVFACSALLVNLFEKVAKKRKKL